MISIHSIFSLCCWCLRPFLKWLLRKTTKLCELQRICYGEISGAPRTLAVEFSLLKSRNPALRELPFLFEKRGTMPYRIALKHAIETVIISKKINPRVHVQFFKSFAKCLEQIWSYLSLMNTIEDLRKTQYDCHNVVHEEKLLKLWSLLVPDIKLDARVTKQWQFIGFQACRGLHELLYQNPQQYVISKQVRDRQIHLYVFTAVTDLCLQVVLNIYRDSFEKLIAKLYCNLGSESTTLQNQSVVPTILLGDDPKTDFRGMGILGLENLLFFASEYTNIAQKILLRSQHPKHGYAFAIVGINLTHLTYYLVKDGAAKTHMYNATRSPLSIRTFHQLYSYLYVEFDKFWSSSKPNNIMDFSFIKDKFEKNIRESLSNSNTVFRINVVVDEI